MVDRSRPLPPSLAQRRLWFLSQLDGAAGAAYHMPVSLRLEGELDVAVLRAALDALVARHESLRTRFLARDGEPEQVIDPADRGFALRELDVSLLPADERAEAVAAHAREA
ncbi:condensation domain-containing protein, partial [Xanthomonas arboricola]|uniref:condensation domain-containing protein n=1 Tax=Xanthomonas arboricola TaxID=56448 RepID=UPI00137AA2C7